MVGESIDGNIKRKITALMSSASMFNLLKGHPQMRVTWDFFRYFLNYLSPSSLVDLVKKKIKKSLILQRSIRKVFES